MTPGTPDIAELKRLMAEANFHRLEVCSPDGGESWDIHDFPPPNAHGASVALTVCTGIDEQDARAFVAAIKAIPSLLASAEENARLRAENERLATDVREECAKECDAKAEAEERLAQEYVRSDRIFPIYRRGATVAKGLAATLREPRP